MNNIPQIGQRYLWIYEQGSTVDCRLILELASIKCSHNFKCVAILYSKDKDDRLNKDYDLGDLKNLWHSRLIFLPNQDKPQC
jgi:hypothetical protein